MHVLLDSCVHGAARAVIEAAGHDVAAISDLDADPGDEAVLDQAVTQGRILITLDKDFGHLAIVECCTPLEGLARPPRRRARSAGDRGHTGAIMRPPPVSCSGSRHRPR